MIRSLRFKLPLLFIILSTGLYAQQIQKEINDQVWIPFVKTFESRDTEGFMAIHSKEVFRSPRESKVIWNWKEYFDKQRAAEQRAKISHNKIGIDLHFLERIASDDRAIEIGIYRTTMTSPEGKLMSYYGKFLVVLRKENSIWKILVDTDSSEGNTIDEEDFLAAKPMEYLEWH